MHLNEDGTQMTAARIHPDFASLEFHMNVGSPAFVKLKDSITLSTIKVLRQAE